MADKEVQLEIRKHPIDGEMLEIYSTNRLGHKVLWGVVHSDLLPNGVNYDANEWIAWLSFEDECQPLDIKEVSSDARNS